MFKTSQVCLLGLAVLASTAFAKSPEDQVLPHVTGEVLVKIKPGRLSKFLSKKSSTFTVKEQISLLAGDYVLVSSPSKSSLSLSSELKVSPEVAFAEPNFLYRAIGQESFDTPQDPSFGKLWGLSNTGNNEPDKPGTGYSGVQGKAGADVDAERGWQITKGSKKVLIAVIDTGIDYNHPDLKNNMWTNEKEIPGNNKDDDGNGFVDDIHGWNAFAKNGNPMDGQSHGTHCAGTIGAQHNNGIGVSGVMDEVSLMAVKFLSDEGSGSLADAVIAIDYATKMNVDIMSNSWGGGGFSQSLFDVITTAKNKGILFVAAAGNDASNNDVRASYPATYQVDNVVSVASHTVNDEISSFSNYGKRTVHVAAPGSNILSTTPNNTYKVMSGTSMATPHVSGVLGLLLAQEGRLPVNVVRERLMATTNPAQAYRRSTKAGGRVSVYNLLTDTRIPRPGPNEASWRTQSLNEVFESAHPYVKNTKISQTYTFPGAKYVRVIVETFDTESGYDFLTLKDGKGSVIEKISGKGSAYQTDYAETDSITLEFSSDTSMEAWGVAVREVQVIY